MIDMECTHVSLRQHACPAREQAPAELLSKRPRSACLSPASLSCSPVLVSVMVAAASRCAAS